VKLALLVLANVAAGYPQGVQLTVSIRGGVMDDDRVISVYGDHLTVTDHGKIRASRRLESDSIDQLERLANDVMGVNIPDRVHPKAVDSGTTTIEIASGKIKRIELWAGEDAPEPVWALLDAVEALSRNAESWQY
jgi:hypothetical protein